MRGEGNFQKGGGNFIRYLRQKYEYSDNALSFYHLKSV